MLAESVGTSGFGVVAGAAGGYPLSRIVAGYVEVENVRLPGPLPAILSPAILWLAAVLGALLPAARASRVDVVQALRAE